MKTIFGRFSSATGFKEVFAAVQVHHLIVRLNAGIPVLAFLQGYATKSVFLPSLIGSVVRGVRWTKVAPFVVVSAVIAVINHLWRLLSGHQEIGDAMRLVKTALICNQAVSIAVEAARNASSFGFAPADKPNQITRIRTVLQDFTDRFGYKFRSHIVSPHGLVRGLVVSATSTPILSQNPHILRIGALNV